MIRTISLNPSQTKISGYSSGDTVFVKCDATNEAFSVYLPDATVANATFLIMKIDSSANVVTVYPYSSQTINDAYSVSISLQYDCKRFVPDGSNYYISKSLSGISNSHLGSLGNAGVHTKFAATGLANSLISETGTTINASCYDFIIPYTASTLARFMFLNPTFPAIWQNGIEMDWSAVPKITNVFSYSDISDGVVQLCVGTRAAPKIGMMLRGGAGGDVLCDGNIGFGTTTVGQMQNSMITCMRSGNGLTAGSAWPGMEFTNTLATKGDGVTTFNFAGLKFKAGNSTVNSIFLNAYDDVYSGMLFGTYSNHPTAVETNGVVRQTWAADGVVTIASLAGTGTRNVVVDANGALSAP